MAAVDESGRSMMVPNAEGELITPSIVFFSETEVVVGKNARSAIVAHPEMVAQWVKRDMGAPFYSHPIRGHYLPPEVIQACILRKLKADVTHAVGPDTRAVITVPAYFDEMRRKCTADAGDMAGLRVLDIVNEPTAAALAFGEALGYLTAGGLPREEMHVMVYDLGGGTFDATLLHMASGDIQTIATDGDVQLGGHDWDQRLVDHAASVFMKTHRIDPRQDPAALNRLYQDAMETKHTLSARSRASLLVEFQGRSTEVQVVREQFEEMTADLLDRTAYTSRQLLAAAGLEWKDIKRILLVGGSSRMPMVSRMLKTMTKIEPDRTVNPDEAVARGAALYANHLLAKEQGSLRPVFRVTNVNAHSLGIEGIDTDTLRKKNVVLIPRNSPLPARHTERFCTKSEGQRSIVLKVLEGESSLPGECIAIGRTVVRELPAGLPKGWPVEVTFEYGTNGRLTVQALVPGTKQQACLELERDAGLSGEGLARWKEPVVAAAGFGAFAQAVEDALRAPKPAATGDASAAAGGWALEGEERVPKAKAGGPKVDLALPPTSAAGARPPESLALPPTLAGSPAPADKAAPAPTFAAAPRPAENLALPPGFGGRGPAEKTPEKRPDFPPQPAMPVPPREREGAKGPDLPPQPGAPAPMPQMPPIAAEEPEPLVVMPDAHTQPLGAPQSAAGPAGFPSTFRDTLAAGKEDRKRKREPLMPLGLQRTIGHIIAGLLGLGGAMLLLYIMAQVRSDLFKWPPW
jgi:molecular chaperone DnaK